MKPASDVARDYAMTHVIDQEGLTSLVIQVRDDTIREVLPIVRQIIIQEQILNPLDILTEVYLRLKANR